MKKNRIFAFILSIAILFGLSPLFGEDVYAQPHEVQIRVEGKEKTLYKRTVTVTDKVYCQDYLNAFSENNINDGWITTLFGETPDYAAHKDSWMNYFVKDGIIDDSKPVNTYRLSDADEIVLYVSNLGNDGTYIPAIDVEKNGETVTLSVYGQNWNGSGPCKNIPLTISYIESPKTDDEGKYSFDIRGIHKVQIGDYPELVRKTIYVSDDEVLNKVEEAIRDIKNHYNSLPTWNTWVSPAYYRISTTDKEFQDINKKYINSLDENADVNAYAHHIIGLLAAGKDPRNTGGKDYVKLLEDTQRADGKFLKDENDPFYVTYQSFAILALDLAQADYNKSKAIQSILAAQNADGSFGDWGTDGTAMTLFALANHKNEPNATNSIQKALNNLKSQQADTGGFTSFGSESAETTAMVMKALIALDINPLSDEWLSPKKNNMLDALLSYRQGGQFINAWSGEINGMTTEQAFSALVDLYKAESIYQDQSLSNHYKYAPNSWTDDRYGFEFSRKDEKIFKKGEEAKLDITVKNLSDKDQQATCIVALYKINGADKRLDIYTFITKTIPAGDSEDITAGLLIPASGDYEIKALLWDDFNKKQPLAEPIDVNVQ